MSVRPVTVATARGRALVAYATRLGSTRDAAEAVASGLRGAGLETDVVPAREVRGLEGYGAVVLGTALYVGRWHRDVRGFLARHRRELADRRVAVFVLGPVKVPRDEDEWRGSRRQMDAELARYPWLAPVSCELFGGRFDPRSLPFPLDRLAAAAPASDALDLDAVRAWASGLVNRQPDDGPGALAPEDLLEARGGEHAHGAGVVVPG